MPAKHFLDTNVLIYAVAKNDPRASKAEALLASGNKRVTLAECLRGQVTQALEHRAVV